MLLEDQIKLLNMIDESIEVTLKDNAISIQEEYFFELNEIEQVAQKLGELIRQDQDAVNHFFTGW